MESTLLKAAIIGCGRIGWAFQDDPGAARFGICTHAAAWSAIEGAELAAVADALPASAKRCAARWQVPVAFETAKELLENVHPHLVSVASPDKTHFAVTQQCLEHPSVRAVLVEKPLAATAAEARKLDALARSLGKTVVVNYIRRFCPIYQQLRARLNAGEFGRLRLARGLYTKGMRHNGSHALDLLQFFFPGLRFMSRKRASWLPVADETDPDLEADLEFALAGGISGVLHSLPFQDCTLFELDLVFEKARLIFTEGGDLVEEHAVVVDRPFTGYRSLVLAARHEHALKDYLLHATRHLLAVMGKSAENISGIRDSVLLLEEYEKLQPIQPTTT